MFLCSTLRIYSDAKICVFWGEKKTSCFFVYIIIEIEKASGLRFSKEYKAMAAENTQQIVFLHFRQVKLSININFELKKKKLSSEYVQEVTTLYKTATVLMWLS